MSSLSSSPRGERDRKPGSSWESWVEWTAETWEPDPDTTVSSGVRSETVTPDANRPQPPRPPNRATRRAIARSARRRKS